MTNENLGGIINVDGWVTYKGRRFFIPSGNVIGATTRTGVRVNSISNHAEKRMGKRKMSPKYVEKLIVTSNNIVPRNRPHTIEVHFKKKQNYF